MDSVNVVENLVAPESEDAIAACLKPPIAGRVAALVRRLCVLTSVNLDDQPPRSAEEVRNVRSNGDLATKAMTGEFRIAQVEP